MQILFINNDGGGFADRIDVDDGATVESLFAERVPGRAPGDYLIRVNRQPAVAEQGLRDGDRVSFTPLKIEGAASSNGRSRRRQQARQTQFLEAGCRCCVGR